MMKLCRVSRSLSGGSKTQPTAVGFAILATLELHEPYKITDGHNKL